MYYCKYIVKIELNDQLLKYLTIVAYFDEIFFMALPF